MGEDEGDCVRDDVTVTDDVGLGVDEGDCVGLAVAESLSLAPKDLVADVVRDTDAVPVAVTVVDTEDEFEEELEKINVDVRETVTVAVGVGDGLREGEDVDDSDVPRDTDCDGVCESDVLNEELGVGVRVTDAVADSRLDALFDARTVAETDVELVSLLETSALREPLALVDAFKLNVDCGDVDVDKDTGDAVESREGGDVAVGEWLLNSDGDVAGLSDAAGVTVDETVRIASRDALLVKSLLADESREGDTLIDPNGLLVLVVVAIALADDVVTVVELLVITDDVGLAEDVSAAVESDDSVPQALALELALARLSVGD